MLYRGTRVGSETVSVSNTGSGWLIASSGRLSAPVDLVTTKLELRYGSDWQPQQVLVESVANGSPFMLTSSFGLTTANNELVQNGRRAANSHTVSPRSVVLPANSFAAYEALAARLGSAAAGTRLPIYAVPDVEFGALVDRVTPRRISLPSSAVEVREFAITLTSPTGPIPVQIWIDERSRLVRVALPAASLIAIREDLATVMAREERGRNAGDEDVFIGAAGFNLGATITKPAKATGKLPVVILISGPGPQDRDYSVFGIPIFANIAGALAESGHFVVRYDARGTGRSGGRTENATLAEYGGDVQQIVNWLRRRQDIDDGRIAVVGYGDAGPIALVAAARERRIRAIALVAAPGRSGREVTLEQQDRMLAALSIPEAERAAKSALQRRIVDAVMTGQGWEGLSADTRAQADTPWFKSWLQFDPATAIGKLEQPILIVHGTLDMETPIAHADRLEQLSAARRRVTAVHTRKEIADGVNHLLVPAKTGATSEYDLLETHTVSAAVTGAIGKWLGDMWTSREID